jgi:hypothetical protein
MSDRQTVVAVAIAVTALLASPPMRSSAEVAPPAHPHHTHPTIVLRTGSAKWLIYGEAVGDPRRVVYARSKAGHTQLLSRDSRHDVNWSVLGDIVTADHLKRGGSTGVRWWNLRTHRHGRIPLRRRFFYMSAAPHGFFYSNRHGQVLRRRLSGGVKKYGRPFKNEYIFSSASGPKGLVIPARTVKYMRYSQPGHFRTLDIGGKPTDGIPECLAATGRFAACFVFDDLTDSAPVLRDLLVPLDGSPPTVTDHCPGYPTISGDTLLWSTWHASDRCTSRRDTIESITVNSHHVVTSSTRTGPSAVTAYGHMVTTGHRRRTVLIASSAHHSSALFIVSGMRGVKDA